MLTNISNLNATPVGADEAANLAVRRDDGRFPGWTLLFCVCPQCGATMHGDGRHFFCHNHTGDFELNVLGKDRSQRNIPVTLVYEHQGHTGTLLLKGPRRSSGSRDRHTAVQHSDRPDILGLYPVLGPAGGIS